MVRDHDHLSPQSEAFRIEPGFLTRLTRQSDSLGNAFFFGADAEGDPLCDSCGYRNHVGSRGGDVQRYLGETLGNPRQA